RFQSFAGVGIDSVLFLDRLGERHRQPHENRLVLPDEFFAHADVFIGKVGDFHWLLMAAGFLQMLAIERAVDRIFAFSAAADGTDFTAHTGTTASRAPFVADLAGNAHQRISLSYHRSMPRTDVYIKVELDVDEREKPERVASEICRM